MKFERTFDTVWGVAEPMFATVVGVFESLASAEKGRDVLLAAGVPKSRIALIANPAETAAPGEPWVLHVYAESSFERARIQHLLQTEGACRTELREGELPARQA